MGWFNHQLENISSLSNHGCHLGATAWWLEVVTVTVDLTEKRFSELLHGDIQKTHAWVVVSNILYFHPYLGKIPILANIFQRGWFNHQLDVFFLWRKRHFRRILPRFGEACNFWKNPSECCFGFLMFQGLFQPPELKLSGIGLPYAPVMKTARGGWKMGAPNWRYIWTRIEKWGCHSSQLCDLFPVKLLVVDCITSLGLPSKICPLKKVPIHHIFLRVLRMAPRLVEGAGIIILPGD